MGDETVHVGEIGLSHASDQEIIERGRNDGSIVVTLDADFHTILAQSKAVTPSAIRIRIEGLKGDDIAGILQEIKSVVGDDLQAGAAVSISEDGLRVRRLPLAPSNR